MVRPGDRVETMGPSGKTLVRAVPPRPVRLQLLVVGSLPAARDRLRRLVDQADDMSWLSSTSSAGAAALMIAGLRPDIVLLHGTNPVVVRELRTTYPWLTVIVLADDARQGATGALRAAGAHAVLASTCPPGALLGGIRLAHVARQVAARGRETEKATGRLSERQRDVLVLIADGNGNAEIASALFISIETVRSHVKEILRRLHARDRAHAVSVGFRTGLLDLSPRDAVAVAAPGPR